MQTISDFLGCYPITLTTVKVPNRYDVSWAARDCRHYVCILLHGEQHMLAHYSCGIALSDPPSLASILDCLAHDATLAESAGGFSDWCGESGCSDDSIRERKVFRSCRRQSRQLRRLLGDEAYHELLYETERL